MEYHRAQSIDEALSLLKAGVPLAGGISLAPRRRGLSSVVDLQDIGLNTVELSDTRLIAGACVNLQTLAESGDLIPPALAQACRLEAGWNLRNMATLAGTLMAADGRSPLVTTLLALGVKVVIQPGDESLDLDDLLARRENRRIDGLITTVLIPRPRWVAYEQVARSPADRPIVCAAVAEIALQGRQRRLGVALGGFGARPTMVVTAEIMLGTERTADDLGSLAAEAYAQAGDAWASAAYRSDVAGTLVRRLVLEAAA